MIYNFDEIIDRRRSDSVKWNRFDEDVLPMWVADMDFRSPEPVNQALIERIQHGVFGYPGESLALKRSIVDWMENRFHWEIQVDDIVGLPGVVNGFNLVAQELVGPGNGVVMQVPVYMPFLTVGKNLGGLSQEASLAVNGTGRYSLDAGVFEEAIDECTRLFLLCSPHNPVGRVWSQKELETMAEISLRHDLAICSDEIHADLVYSDAHHIPLAAIDADIAQHTITLMAPSKTFNIPGLNYSFAIIQNPELRKKVQVGRRGVVGEPNLLGMAAATAAYREGAEWLDQLLVYLKGNRDFLVDWIRQEIPSLKVSPPEGTYLAWIDCRGAGLGKKASEFFLKKGKLGLNDGGAFGKGGDGFVRLNFACPRSTLVEGLNRMKTALEMR